MSDFSVTCGTLVGSATKDRLIAASPTIRDENGLWARIVLLNFDGVKLSTHVEVFKDPEIFTSYGFDKDPRESHLVHGNYFHDANKSQVFYQAFNDFIERSLKTNRVYTKDFDLVRASKTDIR